MTDTKTPEPLDWRSLAPSLSIAVFLTVSMFTMDSTGSARIGLALVVGLIVGPVISYLFDPTVGAEAD